MAELLGSEEQEEWYGPAWECGDCHATFMLDEDHYAKFCPHCGTTLKEILVVT